MGKTLFICRYMDDGGYTFSIIHGEPIPVRFEQSSDFILRIEEDDGGVRMEVVKNRWGNVGEVRVAAQVEERLTEREWTARINKSLWDLPFRDDIRGRAVIGCGSGENVEVSFPNGSTIQAKRLGVGIRELAETIGPDFDAMTDDEVRAWLSERGTIWGPTEIYAHNGTCAYAALIRPEGPIFGGGHIDEPAALRALARKVYEEVEDDE